jgi:hypothetical protein
MEELDEGGDASATGDLREERVDQRKGKSSQVSLRFLSRRFYPRTSNAISLVTRKRD